MHKYFITIVIGSTLFLGCSGNEPKADIPADASMAPVSLLVGTYFFDNSDESEFEVSIGGEVRESWQRVLPWEEYLSEQTVIEVRHKLSGKLLSHEVVKPSCVDYFPFTSEATYQCVAPSGQLGRGVPTCENGEVGELFSTGTGCEHTCFVFGCPADFHCGTFLAHQEPDLIQYNCVPVGEVAVGESCSFGDSGLSSCEEGSGCIDGTCKWFCNNPGEKGQCGEALCMESPVIAWVGGWGICE